MAENKLNRAAVPAAFLVLLLSACASFDTRIPADWAPRAELTEIPFYPQLEHHCGPAALITVLEASGARPSYQEVVDRIFVPDLEGSLQVELMAATRSFGRIPFRLPGRLQPVLAEVEAGRPVLILQNLRVPSMPAWHYAVVVGYDRERADILMRSGNERIQMTRSRRWMRQWDWASRWAIVVLEPGLLPVDPSLPAVLRALADFDDFAAADPRLRAWRSVTDRWPEEPLAWLGAGNALYALGAREAALADWARALEIDPSSWPARLNRAQTLAELDRPCQGLQIVSTQPMPADHPLNKARARLVKSLERGCGQAGK